MPVRLSAAFGLLAIAGCLVLVGVLHGQAGDRVDPIRLTISEYALGDHGWMFDVGLSALAAGSALVLLALLLAGLLRWPSGGAIALAVWAVALPVLVAFQKADWSVGPSVGGYVHRYACLTAFVALPVAALAAGRRWRADPLIGRLATGLRILGLLSFGWLSSIVFGMLLYPLTGVSWWQIVPLGLVERGLVLTEIAALVLLGCAPWRTAEVPSARTLVGRGTAAAR